MAIGLSWLPIVTVFVSFAALAITYGLGIFLGHVHPVFPFVSDAGKQYPESSLFSLLFDVVAVLVLANVYTQYLVVNAYRRRLENSDGSRPLKCLRIINNYSLLLGLVACGGVITMANFAVDENIYIHLVGAVLCFSSALIFCFLQSWLTYRLQSEVSQRLSLCRLLLSIANFAAFLIGVVVYGNIYYSDVTDEFPMIRYRRISAGCEWFCIINLNLFFLTFTKEFSRVDLSFKLLFLDETNNSWNAELPNKVIRRLSSDVSGTFQGEVSGHLGCLSWVKGILLEKIKFQKKHVVNV